jgi:hypothetical protein
MTDDDDLWLDALAGRAVTDERNPVAYEARQLREALLRQRGPQQVVDAPRRDARRERALLARAEREGLIRLSRRPAMLAYAAVVALVAIAMTWFLRPVQEVERVRGVADGTVTLEAADPASLKKRLLDDLRAAGVSATGYERFGVQGIDADLPRPVPERVRAVLAKHHIALPEDGVLKIEITAPDEP